MFTIFFQGLFAPLTMEGNIVVDGIIASCYPDYDHDAAHISMTPMRWFPVILEWIFGDDKGLHIFVKRAEDFREFGQL